MKKILIINPFGIGDVLFTTPLFRNLRRAYPKARIAYIANQRAEEVLRQDPDINHVFVYERDAFVSVYRKNPLAFAGRWFAFFQEIRQEGFDVVFDFSMNSTFGFLCFACGIPRRIGFDFKGRGRFLTDKLPLSGYEGRHVIEYYLQLLHSIGVEVVDKNMALHVPVKDLQWAKEWLKKHTGDTQKPLIALVPGGGASWGASAKFKRWPASQYALLADKLIEKFDAAIILLGDFKEQELCGQVAAGVKGSVYSAAGQTSILQMAALLKQCRLAIVNDGGPLHIAVAGGVPTVSIFGPVDPVVYGPYPSEGHAVVQKGLACQPCYRRFRMAQCSHLRCLNDLTIEEVYRKVESIL